MGSAAISSAGLPRGRTDVGPKMYICVRGRSESKNKTVSRIRTEQRVTVVWVLNTRSSRSSRCRSRRRLLRLLPARCLCLCLCRCFCRRHAARFTELSVHGAREEVANAAVKRPEFHERLSKSFPVRCRPPPELVPRVRSLLPQRRCFTL